MEKIVCRSCGVEYESEPSLQKSFGRDVHMFQYPDPDCGDITEYEVDPIEDHVDPNEIEYCQCGQPLAESDGEWCDEG